MIFNDMKSFTLSELCEIKYGKDHKKLLKGSIPVYGTGGIMRYADSYLYDKESVLIPRKGTLSNIFFVKGEFWTVDTLFWTKINENLITPKFLYYKLLTINFSEMNVGSAVPSLTTKLLNRIQLEIPALENQKVIANILSSLDDKIELNNKINKNLEKLAQTLYKQWFVDFEFPNEDGEPYKSSGGEMVESELGLIPKGWRILTLEDLVVKSRTKTNPDSNQKLIDMANMPSYSIALNSFGYGDKLSTNTYRMNKFSLLYGSIRPYLGKFGIAPFEGITTGTIHNFNVKDNSDYSLVATTVFSTKFNEFCIRLSHGTKMPTIKWDDFVSYKVIYSGEVSYKFNKIVRVMFDRIVNNVLENLKLSKTRDELLPKLMNGEIEVPIEE